MSVTSNAVSHGPAVAVAPQPGTPRRQQQPKYDESIC
jgi:hypothetical protein